MTIPSENKRNDYIGNGSLDTYSYGFKILSENDLKLTWRNTDDIEVELVLNVDYTVTGVGAAVGGTIVLTAGNLATDYHLTIRRDSEFVQESDIRNQGDSFPDKLENALDYVMTVVQTLKDLVDRSIKIPETYPDVDTGLPAPIADKALMFNSDGTALILVDPGNVALATPADDSVTGAKIYDSAKFLFPTLLSLQKGIDIAPAAGVLTLGIDGNSFDVTGTDPITSIATMGVGTIVVLHFDDALVLTHHATDLFLPNGGSNITTATGDHAIMVEYSLNKWRCVGFFPADGNPLSLSDFLTTVQTVSGAWAFSGNNTHSGNETFTGGISTTIRDQTRGLVVITNASNPTYQVDIDVDEIILQDSSGFSRRFASVNLTADIEAAEGENALDTGSEASDTWYYTWVIAKADGTVAGLLSASATAPTMPDGYIYKALVGAVRNDGSSNFLPFEQNDNHVEYNAVQTVKDSLSAAAWTSQDLTATAPANAKRVMLSLGSNSKPLGLSPRSDGHAGEYSSYANSGTSSDIGGALPVARDNWMTANIRYEDNIFYYVGSANATLAIVGWEY